MNQYHFLEYEDIQAIQKWHMWLDDNRGDRARLRRAESPEDILLTDAFFHFLKKMPQSGHGPDKWRENLLISASIAGALSLVKADKQSHSRIHNNKGSDEIKKMASFAEQLATPIEGKSNAPMSELRFQQLQKSTTTDDFYRRIMRAIQLLNGGVNIVSLANDIFHWHKEFTHQSSYSPAHRLAVRWATDYFTVYAKN